MVSEFGCIHVANRTLMVLADVQGLQANRAFFENFNNTDAAQVRRSVKPSPSSLLPPPPKRQSHPFTAASRCAASGTACLTLPAQRPVGRGVLSLGCSPAELHSNRRAMGPR